MTWTAEGEGDGLGALGAVDGGSDERAPRAVDAGREDAELVAATTAPDGLVAPAQPQVATTNIAIAAIARLIG